MHLPYQSESPSRDLKTYREKKKDCNMTWLFWSTNLQYQAQAATIQYTYMTGLLGGDVSALYYT